jgi:hypothetical protein
LVGCTLCFLVGGCAGTEDAGGPAPAEGEASVPGGEARSDGSGVRRVDFAGGAIVTGNTELPADVLKAIAGDATGQPVWALHQDTPAGGDTPAERPMGLAY